MYITITFLTLMATIDLALRLSSSFVPFELIASFPTCKVKCLLFGNSELLFFSYIFDSTTLTGF